MYVYIYIFIFLYSTYHMNTKYLCPMCLTKEKIKNYGQFHERLVDYTVNVYK